jgi:hypothetical protein
MTKGKNMQHRRRMLRKRLNSADDPGPVKHSYGNSVFVAETKRKYSTCPGCPCPGYGPGACYCD